MAQIEGVTGQALEDLLTEWLIAIGVEGYSTARAAVARKFTSYDFAGIAEGWTGTWPYAQATNVFTTAHYSFDTHYSSPNFFDLSGTGSTGLRLDALTASGLALDALDQVVLTITRIQ